MISPSDSELPAWKLVPAGNGPHPTNPSVTFFSALAERCYHEWNLVAGVQEIEVAM